MDGSGAVDGFEQRGADDRVQGLHGRCDAIGRDSQRRGSDAVERDGPAVDRGGAFVSNVGDDRPHVLCRIGDIHHCSREDRAGING